MEFPRAHYVDQDTDNLYLTDLYRLDRPHGFHHRHSHRGGDRQRTQT